MATKKDKNIYGYARKYLIASNGYGYGFGRQVKTVDVATSIYFIFAKCIYIAVKVRMRVTDRQRDGERASEYKHIVKLFGGLHFPFFLLFRCFFFG